MINIGDEITINTTIIGITAGGNPIIKLNSGNRFLIKESDINAIHPYREINKEDMREDME